MPHTAATPTQLAERTVKPPRRGGSSRRQMVGDYAGQLAGEAAQAVRRAGLKPGLERSFGFAPELRGQIVAQEPRAGSELARNGLVTLYVAAPGAAPLDQKAVAEPIESERSEVEPARRLAHAEPASDRVGSAPRRRKSRRPSGAGRPAFGAPPPPSLPTVEKTAEALSLDAPDHSELESDQTTEQHVIDADELFAGRASAVAWRRVYPRQRRGRRPRLAGRPRLALAALALLAVWLVVAVAAALIGQRASPPPPRARQGHSRARAQTPPLASVPARASEHHAPRPHRHAAPPQPAPKRRRARRAPAQRAAQQATHAVTTPAAPTPTAAKRTSPPPAPVSRHGEGGLFSP